MRKIPVTRTGKKDSDIILLPVDKVVKIEACQENSYLVHTLNETFHSCSTLEAWEEWLYEDGFRLISPGNLVNMNQVTRYNLEEGTVILGDPSAGRTKTAIASRVHQHHILKLLQMLRITNQEKQQGFSHHPESLKQMHALLAQNQNDPFLRSYAVIYALYERNRAEKRWEESEQKYKSLFEHNPDAICSFDRAGRFTKVNPAAERITGYSADELLDMSIEDLIEPAELEKWTKQFTLSLEGITSTDEVTFRNKEGQIRILSVVYVPIIIEQVIRGVYWIANDVTERKRAEELLIKSEKLSVVGQLAAGVAHEIRNPLTSLKGFVQLLQEKIDGYDTYLDIMVSELERINFIVSEFLVFAKPQRVHFQPKDLHQMLKNTVALLNTKAIMSNVEIKDEIQELLPLVFCDENQIKQVFINVLNNSIEAMPEGGTIRLGGNCKDGQVTLSFSDEGVGISENRLTRIGEPFYTTKEKGTGLGLMASYKIMENHKGRIKITSEVNKGTIVHLRFPVLSGQHSG